MEQHNVAKNYIDPGRLRRFMLIPMGWLVFVVVLPNFVMGVFGFKTPLFSNLTEAVSILLWGGFLAYLLVQVRNERGLVIIVLTGLGLLLLSEVVRVSRELEFLEYLPIPDVNFLSRHFQNAMTGLGYAVIALAFIYAIIDMLAARRLLEAERTLLSQEIEHRKRAETTLRESEARYRSLVDHSGEVVWRMDLDGRFTFVSPVVKKLAGYAPEELIGQPFETVLDTESVEKGRQMLRDRMAGEFRDKSIAFEVISRKKDGSTFPSETLTTPIYDQEGNLLELQGVTRDITERVQNNRLIAEQQAKMIHASRLSALGTMAGGIAHEINNPLAIISVAAETLRTLLDAEPPDRGRIDKMPETIMHHVNRIYRIVQGLKTLSRDDTLDSFSSIPVRNLVADTLELCQRRFMAHGISLIVPEIPAELEITCRRSQFSQVLVNLLNNAYDAVENLPEKWIRLEVCDEGNTIALLVTDSGPGLPPEIRDKVLDPFFTTKEPGKGVGLGLSVSSRLLEAQHGELLIDSDCPNTRFVVRLPKQQPDSIVLPMPEELKAAK